MSANKRVKPSGFEYVPGNIFSCFAPGLAKHDIDLEQEFRTLYNAEMGMESGPQGDTDCFVDPVNGSDTNSGRLHSPYKTVKKAVTSAYGTIWLKPGRYTEKLDIRNTDRQLANGQSRAMMIKAHSGKVVFTAPGQQPSEMTWVASGGAYEATPSGGQLAQVILYIGDGAEIPIQYQTSVANVNSRAYGWYQDPTTKKITIRYEGRNINSDKAKFEIMYQASDAILLGAKVYLEGITFRGGNCINVTYQNDVRPILYAKKCRFEFLAGANIHTEGAICFTQDCVSRRSTVNDGFNYYDSVALGTTPGDVSTEALEIDNACYDNGIPESKGYVMYPANQTRTKQGSSGHQTTKVCRINGIYYGNMGQNIADVGLWSSTWMVGTELLNPWGRVGGNAPEGGYYNLWLEGSINYLDTVKAGGRLSTYGLYSTSGATVKTYCCDFSGTVADIGGDGVVEDYDPLDP